MHVCRCVNACAGVQVCIGHVQVCVQVCAGVQVCMCFLRQEGFLTRVCHVAF